MSKAYASPLKIVEIREYARKLRSLLSLGPLDWISLPKLYDMLACLFSDNGFQFDYRVLPDNDPAFEQREEAYTDMQTGVITIKESVMEKACRKRFNRSAFTLAHELGHYFLHYLQRESKLCRVRDEMPVPVYCDPEWQANVFASEFLMPFDSCLSMEPEDIRRVYHVSREAAEVRYSKIKEELRKQQR